MPLSVAANWGQSGEEQSLWSGPGGCQHQAPALMDPSLHYIRVTNTNTRQKKYRKYFGKNCVVFVSIEKWGDLLPPNIFQWPVDIFCYAFWQCSNYKIIGYNMTILFDHSFKMFASGPIWVGKLTFSDSWIHHAAVCSVLTVSQCCVAVVTSDNITL